MYQYHDLVNHVLTHGWRKSNRTGVDTISAFNYNYKVDLANGFPLLTTKKINWKNIVVENIWFLLGDNNVEFLHKHGCKFWDPWVQSDGTIPSAYGHLWRHPHDQIRWVIDLLRRNPNSRRAVVTPWQPANTHSSSLPPCHFAWVLNNSPEGILNLHLSQRSADIALGVPYNLAGYSFILELMCRFLGMQPGYFAHSIVDAHIYTRKLNGSQAEYDHIPNLKKQIKRVPRKLPKLKISPVIQRLEDLEELRDCSTDELLDIFELTGYNPHPFLKFKPAV